MQPDLIYIDPPFNWVDQRSKLAGLLPSWPWFSAIAPLLDATWDTHVIIDCGDLLFMLPYGLLKTMSGHSPDPSESYPEAFVFGSGEAYAETVHETAAGARMSGLSAAFKAMSVPDRSSLILDPFCGSGSYRCLSGIAAEKLGRRIFDAAARAQELSARWISPVEPVTDGTADGGQDGLLKVESRFFWVQVTGGRMPGILPSPKRPSKIAGQFFVPEGESQMEGGKLKKRTRMFGKQMPAQADVLHLVVGKAASLGLGRATRGVVWERASARGTKRRFVQTITVHPLMIPSRP